MTKKSVETINKSFVLDIRGIIEQSRRNAVRSVDFCRVQMYWNIGRRIQVEEQKGKKRADYGSFLLKNLSKELEPEYGSGFSVRQLEMCRRFYTLYPIANAVRSQLNWTQYRGLIKIDDPEKREYYELETINNAWTSRELERQIHSQLYERLLMSSDTPQEVIKDPMVLEFLGLERNPEYYERDLETAIINHLQRFLLELGNGFAFIARQRRILLEDDLARR
ncbi:Predicted nuclease of restriction endonuclease-like (RecB) superfamily, DUF1016 family [Fibrobacter sp. UWH9]|uniref:PDDEXK nuclease domain-containing protein n=1 Tax=Fibrobacter sp. UWH9 TaxID=1896213 RepID=UPI00091BEFE8|nr:PDDEXK nuclease domain-containing protein [Fibrobacter sp. UWH9]SHH44232.1 Predicted nuclease of restriction endonuclease-like (RecB) superfamily, DUF1016 family [Fibrobacter sp. UWH9]